MKIYFNFSEQSGFPNQAIENDYIMLEIIWTRLIGEKVIITKYTASNRCFLNTLGGTTTTGSPLAGRQTSIWLLFADGLTIAHF